MKREDFVFTIGYLGNTAVIDGKAKKQDANLSTAELARKGLFKAAFCSALYSRDDREVEEFLSIYNASVRRRRKYEKDELPRLFGVYGVPEGIGRTKTID